MATISVAARVRGSLRRLLILATLIPLGACASFDGHPVPVIAVDRSVQIAGAYPVDTALREFYARRTVDERTEYRDMIISIYMTAAESRYQDFRRKLSRQSKGSNFGLGVAALGLSSGASFAGERAANILSAGAAALTGTKSALDKEVYFEKTLPALMAGMDAARTRVRTNILKRMQTKADKYSLAEAFLDLSEYETAASLDSAIQMVTADASRRVAVEENAYDGVALQLTGPPAIGSIGPLREMGTLIQILEAKNDNEALGRIAKVLNIAPGATAQDSADSIRNEIDNRATTPAITEDLAAKVSAAAAPPPAPDPAPDPAPAPAPAPAPQPNPGGQ